MLCDSRGYDQSVEVTQNPMSCVSVLENYIASIIALSVADGLIAFSALASSGLK